LVEVAGLAMVGKCCVHAAHVLAYWSFLNEGPMRAKSAKFNAAYIDVESDCGSHKCRILGTFPLPTANPQRSLRIGRE
jgi:hypothetical protein